MGFGLVNMESTIDILTTNQSEYSVETANQTTAIDNRTFSNVSTYAPTIITDSPYASAVPTNSVEWTNRLDAQPSITQQAAQSQEAAQTAGKSSDWLPLLIIGGIAIAAIVVFKKVK